MRTLPLIIGLFLAFTSTALAGIDAPLLGYHGETGYIPQTPSVSGGAVGAFANPASWATSADGELAFWWNDENRKKGELDNWGLSFGKGLGFAMQRSLLADEGGTFGLYDFQLGLAGGDRRTHFGAAWRFAGRDAGRAGRENALVVGSIHRPNPRVDFGLSGVFSSESERRLGIADLGIRPFKKPWITLFGEYSMSDADRLEDGFWGGGFEVRPWHGIHLGMKFREAEDGDPTYSFNLGLTIDQGGFHVLPAYDQNDDLGTTTFLYRINPPHRGLPLSPTLRKLFGKKPYVKLDLENKRITYQKAVWFEKERIAWIDLARRLDRIRENDTVRGVAVNLAGIRMSPSIAWELREKLEEIRGSGKEVVVHFDRGGSLEYYVVSAADRLSIDPQGQLLLPGLALQRTYMRGLLDKAGIGVDEWRFFTHKSAFEALSRKEMSDADREQLGRLVDVVYETVRDGVCEGRKMTPGDYDALVDEVALFTAEKAYEKGLVDTVARWDALGDWLKEHRNGAGFGACSVREERIYPDEPWGRPPTIALVYALGECAMDTGIRGRATSKHMRGLAKDGEVAAVVLRADSPGGDALPSDLVAEATRKIKEAEKPVVVSQGDVAGSGGYWISMDGSKIYTTPVTITGSIGVIGGWLWDEGIGEKTGFSADGVKRGDHSDLFTGIRFPVLGRLPTRNLTDEERGYIREIFLDLYGEFVGKVAAGRGVSEDHVREVGEGRIWMGEDAVGKQLADEVGGLTDAIAEAKALAGIDPDAEIILAEYPERPRFRMPKLGGSPFDLLFSPLAKAFAGEAVPVSDSGEEDYDFLYLRSLAEGKGAPLLLTPPEAIPEGWRTAHE
ncbi:MAG: S49 family peptidase [Candidatus Eisenbacteria bacterium]